MKEKTLRGDARSALRKYGCESNRALARVFCRQNSFFLSRILLKHLIYTNVKYFRKVWKNTVKYGTIKAAVNKTEKNNRKGY